VNKFATGQLLEGLRAVDNELTQTCDIVLIGGAVLSLSYDAQHATKDIDCVRADAAFWESYRKVRSRDATLPPVEQVGIYTAPYDFEDRLEEVKSLGLARLRVWIPERHDLAIMKLARATEHDLAGLESVHAASPFSLETLIERFKESKTRVIGDFAAFKLNFLAGVERLFGAEAAQRTDGQV
jgi:hypothetical protein